MMPETPRSDNTPEPLSPQELYESIKLHPEKYWFTTPQDQKELIAEYTARRLYVDHDQTDADLAPILQLIIKTGDCTDLLRSLGIEGLDGAMDDMVVGTASDYMGDVLDDVVAVKPNWLLPPWLRRGKLHSLEGKKGVGKSQLSIFLAGRIMQDNEAGKVIIFTTEDDGAEDIKPRAMAAGVDLTRLVVYAHPITFADTDKLTAIIKHHGAVLAVFDTLQRYIPNSRADMKDAHAAQGQLTPLEGVARDTNCAMLLIRHGRKGKVEDAVEAGIGSQGIAGAMRSILVAGKHPRNEGEYALSLAIGNYASTGGSLAYRLEALSIAVSNGTAETCRIDVLREEHDLDADEITAGPTNPHGNDQGAQGDAREFLENILADGEMLQTEILKAAADEGVSKTTLYRVKDDLGVESDRREEPEKKRQYWPKVWRLPKDTRHEKSGKSGKSERQHGKNPRQHWTSQTSQTSQGSQILETPPVGKPVCEHPPGYRYRGFCTLCGTTVSDTELPPDGDPPILAMSGGDFADEDALPDNLERDPLNTVKRLRGPDGKFRFAFAGDVDRLRRLQILMDRAELLEKTGAASSDAAIG